MHVMLIYKFGTNVFVLRVMVFNQQFNLLSLVSLSVLRAFTDTAIVLFMWGFPLLV